MWDHANDSPPVPDEGEEDIREFPDDPDHYRNFPGKPAPQVLEEILQNFKDLTWIPRGGEIHSTVDCDSGIYAQRVCFIHFLPFRCGAAEQFADEFVAPKP